MISEFSPMTEGVLWDGHPNNRNIFIAYGDNEICTYIYVKQSVIGKFVLNFNSWGAHYWNLDIYSSA